MSRPAILVLSATAGAGHLRAGEALQATARFLKLPLDVAHEDVLTYTTPLFRKVYAESYYAVVKTSPELWGYLFRKTGGAQKAKSPFLKLFDRVNYREFVDRIRDARPSAVVCTHFLPYQAIGSELQKAKIPVYAVPTDYYAHGVWSSPVVRRYFVASEETAWLLAATGVPRSQVTVTGIPTMPAFRTRRGKHASREALRLDARSFTILVLSGGYGIGAVDRLVPALADVPGGADRGRPAIQLLVVCGKNKSLFDRLRSRRYPAGVRVQVYPYVDFVDKLMDASDLLVTKSGGLTTAEALNKHLPVVVVDPIPGQEAYNAQYLVEQGAGTVAMNEAYLRYRIMRLLEEKGRLAAMRKNAARIARPLAAETILRDVMADLQLGK